MPPPAPVMIVTLSGETHGGQASLGLRAPSGEVGRAPGWTASDRGADDGTRGREPPRTVCARDDRGGTGRDDHDQPSCSRRSTRATPTPSPPCWPTIRPLAARDPRRRQRPMHALYRGHRPDRRAARRVAAGARRLRGRGAGPRRTASGSSSPMRSRRSPGASAPTGSRRSTTRRSSAGADAAEVARAAARRRRGRERALRQRLRRPADPLRLRRQPRRGGRGPASRPART